MRRVTTVVIAVLVAGCQSDQGLADRRLEILAVADGDFDRMEEVLFRLEVPHDSYEGFISQPVWDPDLETENIVAKTEALFTGESADGDPILLGYDAVLLNSGTRGFGAYEYNSVRADDSFLSNPVALSNLQDFVERGRTLVVSDWAYDAIEAIWPEEITFVNEADGTDAAQAGVTESVIADVVDDGLARDLGASTVGVDFDFTYWTVIEGVGPDVTVHMQADAVDFRISPTAGTGTLYSVPLLVSFPAGNGTVVFSSFHWRAQPVAVIDIIAQSVIEGLAVGTVEPTLSEQIGE